MLIAYQMIESYNKHAITKNKFNICDVIQQNESEVGREMLLVSEVYFVY